LLQSARRSTLTKELVNSDDDDAGSNENADPSHEECRNPVHFNYSPLVPPGRDAAAEERTRKRVNVLVDEKYEALVPQGRGAAEEANYGSVLMRTVRALVESKKRLLRRSGRVG